MNDPINILLIDESARTQDMFGFALNDLNINYSCRYASDVEQALNVLHIRPADYIFVDVNIKAFNSFKAIKNFFRTPFINKPSIVIYTDHPENDLCQRAMKLGVLAGIKKRAEIHELIHELKKILIK